jgi:hypothetical protein
MVTNDREKRIEAGASHYIAKSVDHHEFLSLMRVWTHDRPHRKASRASMAV